MNVRGRAAASTEAGVGAPHRRHEQGRGEGGLPEFQRIAVVGCGLIGGSIELAVNASGAAAVVTLDRGDDLQALREADLVVLAAPIVENVRLLSRVRPHLSPGTVVTDTGSTKAEIVAAAADMRFIGGHPIAGGTGGGAAAARADLFHDHSWVLTPTEHTDPGDLARLRAFVERLGANVQLLGAAEHDRLFALVSHLPQLLISTLMHVVGSGAGADGLALAGPGLHDSTRLAASAPGIWRDIVRTNRANITQTINHTIQALEALRDDESGEQLEAIFKSAANWKRLLDALRQGDQESSPL